MVDKLIVGGEVAVVYSPGFGAGWSTWCCKTDGTKERMIFDRELAQAIVGGDKGAIVEIAERKFPGEYTGGLEDIAVAWLSVGTRFLIEEYDGSESFTILDDLCYMA